MHSISVEDGTISWSGGNRITLRTSDTATCTTLRKGQIYGIFVYNSAQNATDAHVNVNWSNSHPPGSIFVPGTTQNAGLASIGFVSGDDTQTISVSLSSSNEGAQVEVWLGSIGMPTDTSGLNNAELPADGKPHPFDKYRRYFAMPASKWYEVTMFSTITQNISCRFHGNTAVVTALNVTANGLRDGQVQPISTSTQKKGAVEIVAVNSQSTAEQFQGDGGTQWIWMNADSQQNSDDASITLQSL